MSATEIIKQIKALSPEQRTEALRHLISEASFSQSLYDEFTLLGDDAEGCDVSYALEAQAEAALHS
ncbi:MAG TPA: hypothetical protein VN829_20570 [Dongiaceae bacterium]|nr:hypothetical protein [Dongiaceae bacterium]